MGEFQFEVVSMVNSFFVVYVM